MNGRSVFSSFVVLLYKEDFCCWWWNRNLFKVSYCLILDYSDSNFLHDLGFHVIDVLVRFSLNTSN